MKSVCAWCGKGLKASRAGCKGGISYGICLPCANSIFNSTPGLMKEYIDQIDSPVALLNGDGVVMTANALACALLQKELPQIEGVACGELFGCAAPGDRGECGKIGECAGCELKRCVTHTHRTGKRLSRVPAHLRQGGPQAPEGIWWLFSTYKFLDCVVLRISGKTVRKMHRKECGAAAYAGSVPGHSSGQREKRGTATPSERTVSQNIPSGLTQSAPSP